MKNTTTRKKYKQLISINDPAIGSVVLYNPNDYNQERKTTKVYPVYITDGAWEVNNRLSNFWYWKKVNKDGSLSKKEYCGYGHFYKYPHKYKVITRIESKGL